jgi:membrane protein
MSRLLQYLSRLPDGLWLFLKNDGLVLAASIAYSLALSLFPLMLVLVASLGWALQFTQAGRDAQQAVLAAIEEQASPELSEQVARTLTSVEANAGAGGLAGLVTLLVAAIAIFTQIDYAFDRIWENASESGVTWRTRVWRLLFTRLKAVGMLLGVAAFIIAVMISSLVWKGVEENIATVVKLPAWVESVVQPAVHVAINGLAFAVGYRYLPKAPVDWTAALAGGLVTSLGWELGRQVLAAYLIGDTLPTAYGVIGSFMAVMLWTYYAMIIVLFGAAYTRVLNESAIGKPRAA